MKPEKLIISAFGPYAEEIEIDFEKLVYVFDETNDFYKQITVDNDYLLQVKPVEINCPGSDKITVIAWAGLSSNSEEISNMNQANVISDLQVSLKHNNGVANNLPGDLF